MNLAALGLKSEQITFAFWLAIAAFSVYLLIKRLQRLGAPDERPSFYVAEPPADALANPDEPVTIAWFKLAEEAEMWAANLRAEGIDATVRDATVEGTRRVGLRGIDSPQVQVRPADVPRAAQILREAQSKEHPADGE